MNTSLPVKIICNIFVCNVKLYKMFNCNDCFAVIDFFTSIGHVFCYRSFSMQCFYRTLYTGKLTLYSTKIGLEHTTE